MRRHRYLRWHSQATQLLALTLFFNLFLSEMNTSVQ
jgi:hypothetical protein